MLEKKWLIEYGVNYPKNIIDDESRIIVNQFAKAGQTDHPWPI